MNQTKSDQTKLENNLDQTKSDQSNESGAISDQSKPFNRMHPSMEKEGLKREHWRKSGQWIALLRKHAQLVAGDATVSKLFRECAVLLQPFKRPFLFETALPFYLTANLCVNPVNLRLPRNTYALELQNSLQQHGRSTGEDLFLQIEISVSFGQALLQHYLT